jgi:hypothetical protein
MKSFSHGHFCVLCDGWPTRTSLRSTWQTSTINTQDSQSRNDRGESVEYGAIPEDWGRESILNWTGWYLAIRDKPGFSWRDPAQVSDLASNNESGDRRRLYPRGSMLSLHTTLSLSLVVSLMSWLLRILIARLFQSITTNLANSQQRRIGNLPLAE